jgi:hypothetical protein
MEYVVNVKSNLPFAVYIGRANGNRPASVWANPFSIKDWGDRQTVIDLYHDYLLESPALLARLPLLHGKTLGCWCHPHACHGDILAGYANSFNLWTALASRISKPIALAILGEYECWYDDLWRATPPDPKTGAKTTSHQMEYISDLRRGLIAHWNSYWGSRWYHGERLQGLPNPYLELYL